MCLQEENLDQDPLKEILGLVLQEEIIDLDPLTLDIDLLNRIDLKEAIQMDKEDHTEKRTLDRIKTKINHQDNSPGKIQAIEMTNKPYYQSNNQYGYSGSGEQDQYGHNHNNSVRREYPQYQNQQYPQHDRGNRYDQYQYKSRRSPIHTYNKYEALRDYRDQDQTRSFLDYHRSERTPPRQEKINKRKES